MTDYSFIGIGRMGANMAKRLLAAGYSVTVYDTSKAAVDSLVEAGAVGASTPADAANAAKTAFLSLPTPNIVHTVTLGPNGVHESSTVKHVVDVSTTGPQMARTLAAELGAKGIEYVDAPVSGGIAGAVKGTLAVMVSGNKSVYEEIRPALDQFGKVFFVGEKPGQGQVMKVANNMLAAAAMVLSSEAVVMGTKAGLDPAQMLDVINSGSGRNSATQDKIPRCVLNGAFDFGFAIGLSYKDVRLCIQEADQLGVPMLAGSVVLQMLGVTQAKYGADADFTTIARVIEEWANVEVRG